MLFRSNVLDNMLHRIGLSSVPCRSKADLDIALADIAHFDCILTDREMGALTGNDILRCCKKAASNKPALLFQSHMHPGSQPLPPVEDTLPDVFPLLTS